MVIDAVLKEVGTAPPAEAAALSGETRKFDPVLLELGEAGEDGFYLLFRKYMQRVRRFFEKKGFSPEESKDLCQDTFLRALRGRAILESRAQLEAWLFQIASNVAASARRSHAAVKRTAILISLDEPHPDGDRENPGEPAFATGERDALTSAITREQITVLHQALAELPEQMRQCVCFRIRDIKYKDIAVVMGISIETVKSQIHDAKKRLRPLLAPHFEPTDL